jgi:hypothetical protein
MIVSPTTYPIAWLADRNNEKTLILKPPYHRKPVWTDDQKAYLVDTVLKKYHIPEIYIHRETDDSGKSVYNIVDGQQRVRALLDFLTGDFCLSAQYTPEYADYSFEDLPQSIKRDFYSYVLYAREITGASEEEVRNLFKRMNRNVVALNPQELRHATYSGEFIKLMEEFAEDDFWAENRIVSAKEIRRMNDVQFISELFVAMMQGVQDKTKELDRLYEYYESEGNFTDKSKWKKRFQKIIDLILLLYPDLRSHRWRNKPDFYTLFVALNLEDDYYIPDDKIPTLRKELTAFSETVNRASRKDSKGKKYAKAVLDYVIAVTRSTADKDRRLMRLKIVSGMIQKYVNRRKRIVPVIPKIEGTQIAEE